MGCCAGSVEYGGNLYETTRNLCAAHHPKSWATAVDPTCTILSRNTIAVVRLILVFKRSLYREAEWYGHYKSGICLFFWKIWMMKVGIDDLFDACDDMMYRFTRLVSNIFQLETWWSTMWYFMMFPYHVIWYIWYYPMFYHTDCHAQVDG